MNNQNLVPFFVTGTLLMVVFVFFLIVFLIVQKAKQNRQENEMLYARIDEKERTMQTISMEIHDNVNQMLNLTRMTLRMINKYAVPEQVPLLEQAGNILDNLIIDVHNISHTLNTEYLKKRGLIESLQQDVNWANISKKIECSLDIQGNHIAFPPEKELMLVRIAQEAINNTLKHSNATRLEIQLNYTGKEFKMSIADNGSGFNFDPDAPVTGVGLQSMHQRTRIIDGKLTFKSMVGSGTTVILTVPYTDSDLLSRRNGTN